MRPELSILLTMLTVYTRETFCQKKLKPVATMILWRKLFAKKDQTSGQEPSMLPTKNNDDLENWKKKPQPVAKAIQAADHISSSSYPLQEL